MDFLKGAKIWILKALELALFFSALHVLNDFTLPKKIPSAKHVSQFYRFTEARAGTGLNFSGLSFFRAFRFELGRARAF